MKIRNKVVLITGASAGIGLAAVRRFAAEGAKLALVARSADKLQELAKELQQQGNEAVALPADVSDAKQVQKAIEETVRHFGRLDAVINNVGQAAVGTIADMDPDNFRKIVDLNVFGPLAAMQAAIPIMREQGGGLIINISSVVSKMNIPGLGAYAATKSALNMLTDTARGELAADNIRVITVYPRSTATDFGKNALGQPSSGQERKGAPNADTPEYVAEKILAAAVEEPEEQFMD
ncbi:SDR family oxidoreductase [Metabacillus sp. GX 13764]|uniref:SDR family NAD(P)-dependent oxidoreductase n=1 Tax=Metabacillus kandeliae TaxID=2900151 RepID=UPI001E4B01A4|nr:SDR family oxidoreductase [Metabacillus kandeliae]MCD7035101.1 SDR family oxidoreductase [Metabacillus kandeliae]